MMSAVKYHSNYITSEMSKSGTVYLNGKGSNLISSCVSGCVIGCYLLSLVKKTKTIKTYYNKVWAKNGLSKNNKYRYYL